VRESSVGLWTETFKRAGMQLSSVTFPYMSDELSAPFQKFFLFYFYIFILQMIADPFGK
jgi:hypothetical protein